MGGLTGSEIGCLKENQVNEVVLRLMIFEEFIFRFF